LCAAEAVILADEVIGYTRAAIQPLSIQATVLAESLQLIDEVGPFGEYVSNQHTLDHFRDFWYPSLFDRGRFDPVKESVGPDLEQRLNARARQLIEKHQPQPLAEDLSREIDRIEASWYERLN